MSQYIIPEKYQNYIYSDIIKQLDKAFYSLEEESIQVRERVGIPNFFEQLNELEKNAEALCIFSEYLENSNIKNFSGYSPDEFLVISARLYQKALEIIDDAKKIGVKVSSEQIFRYRMYATINFYASRRHAISVALSKKLEYDINNLNSDFLPIRWLYEIIIDLMSLNYNSCADKCKQSLYHIQQKITNSQEFDSSYLVILPFIGVVIKTLGQFIKETQKGDLTNAQKSVKKLKDQAIIFDKLGYTELSFILFKLSCAINHLNSFSIWRLREILPYKTEDQKSKVDHFIRQYIQIGRYYLFYSQYQALFEERILQRDNHQILSMPTGAGKTLLAHLLLFKKLLQRKDLQSKVIYLVPTRALAHEKLIEFEQFFSGKGMNYRVCKITGEILLESHEVIEKNDILIMTQEKFDILMRAENFFGFSIDSIISDEYHNVYIDYRGIRLQLSLERFKRKAQNRDTNIFLISAIIPKVDQENISRWLFPEDTNQQSIFRTQWQPTFTRRGYFDFIEESQKSNWFIHFNDGRTLKLKAPPGKKPGKKFHKGATNRASAYIAAQLSQVDQVYLYSLYRMGILDRAEEVCNFIENFDYSYIDKQKRDECLKKIKKIIGKNRFVDVFEKGVAVHHGHLPLAIRSIIEDAIDKKAIPIVCATSTLAQGVNLPIKSIIIPKPQSQKNLMDFGLFLNLIGRAGRPGKTDEGQVILLTSKKRKKDYPDFTKEIIDTYLQAKADDITENLSPIRIIKTYRGTNQTDSAEYLVLLGVLETMLLAIIAEKIFDNFREDALLDAITIGSQNEDFREFVHRLLIEIEDKFVNEYRIVSKEDTKLRITHTGQIIYESGFSPSTSLNSTNWLRSKLYLLRNLERINYDIYHLEFGKIWEQLLSHILTTPEGQMVQGRYYKKTYKRALWALYLWAEEENIEDIAERYYDNDILEALSDVDGNLNGFAAWGLSAMSKWVHLLEIPNAKEHEKQLFNLSKFVWYGVNHPSQLSLIKKDESKRLLREDVLTLTSEIRFHRIPNFIRNPNFLKDPKIQDKIRSIPQLKIDGNEVVENLKKIYNIL